MLDFDKCIKCWNHETETTIVYWCMQQPLLKFEVKGLMFTESVKHHKLLSILYPQSAVYSTGANTVSNFTKPL